MTDFIPGEAYRLDVKAADDKIIVDSWQNRIRADIVSDDGAIQVDVATGKLYGPLVGNIEDADGNLVFNLSAQVLRGDIEGSVYDSTGMSKLIDGMSGKVLAPSEGNLVDTQGNIIVDTINRTITASSFNGDVYGDLYGNISSDSVIYGTFSGDFNGTAYGEFFGETTGEHTGNVTGDLIGNVTGNVEGYLTGFMLGTNLDTSEGAPPVVNITSLNETTPHPQYSFFGGLEHHLAPPEDAVARGPIVLLGETRADTSVRAHLHHYNGQEIITLHDTLDPGLVVPPATIRGFFDGNFIYSNENGAQDIFTASETGTVLHGVNNLIHIGGHIKDNPEVDVNIMASTVTIEANSNENDIMFFKKHRGTLTDKQAVSNNDALALIFAQGFNGNGYADGGRFGLLNKGTPDQTSNYLNTEFTVSLPNSAQGSTLDNNNILTFDNRGVLEVNTFKSRGMTFAARDSMVAEAGMIIFNTSSSKFQGYTGTTWVDLH